MIEVQFNEVDPISIDYLSSWYTLICEYENKVLGEIGVVIGTDNWLLEQNIKYLNHNFYTDIITFDYCEENIINGDLLISMDRVIENASSFNVSISDELNRVLAHGVLHLCGYGDHTKEEIEIIRAKEDFYLNLL